MKKPILGENQKNLNFSLENVAFWVNSARIVRHF